MTPADTKPCFNFKLNVRSAEVQADILLLLISSVGIIQGLYRGYNGLYRDYIVAT